MRRVLPVITLAIVVAIGGWTKWRVLPTFETHVDDLLVAVAILDWREQMTEETLRARLGHGRISDVLRWVDRQGHLGTFAAIAPYFAVPLSSTYAPGQFFLTTALLRDRGPYRGILVRGRLPSFFFGLIAPALTALVVLRLSGRAPWPRAVLAAAVVACSWELFIFSEQMQSYAVGTTGVLLMLWMLITGPARVTVSRRFAEGIALALVPWLQYQLVFMLPAYVLARAWQLTRLDRRPVALIRASLPIAVPALASAIAMFVFFLAPHAGSGVNWNAGPDREFLFDIPAGASIAGAIWYAIRFFAGNTFLVIAAMAGFLPEGSVLYTATAVALTALMLAGIYALSRRAGVEGRSMLVFAGVLAATWFVLIAAGLLTLGPTRHALIFLPLIALFVAEGCRAALALPAAALVITGFLVTYPGEVARRTDPFDETRIQALVRQTQPDAVFAYSCTRNLLLMANPGAPVFDWHCGITPRWSSPVAEPGRVLFISSREPLSREIVLDAAKYTPLAGPDAYEWHPIAADPGQRPIEASSRTNNGQNALYATLLVRRGAD